MVNLTVTERSASVVLLKHGYSDIEGFQWILTSGNKSMLEDTRRAHFWFKTIPVLVLEQLTDFMNQNCGKYDWLQIKATYDSHWDIRFEMDGIVQEAEFEDGKLDWIPIQVIID